MAEQEVTLWGIHAGAAGQGDSLFLSKNCIAVGWNKTGDLSQIPADRDNFKTHLAKTHPETKPGALPVHAGVLYRFVHDIKEGDLVVYPSKVDRQVHIGTIEGPYEFTPHIDAAYPHTRRVKWGKSAARTSFTQGALYEIGSAVTLFSVRNYADEFISVYKGTPLPETQASDDETLPYVAQEVHQNTRDYVLKRLSQHLKGHPFAQFVAHLLEHMGYQTRVSPPGADKGIDIVAHKDELGFEPPIIKVQVKSTDGNTGDPDVSALYGKIAGSGEFALFITLGGFTSPAKAYAAGKSNLRLIEGEELVDLIFQYYEKFDSKYKGLLRLTQVYIPDTLEED